MKRKHSVQIQYCIQCKWLLRAAWFAQELLSTFEEELSGVTLVPAKGGLFEIRIGKKLIWSRKKEGGFPEVKELKKRVRDIVSPGKNMGHIDR